MDICLLGTCKSPHFLKESLCSGFPGLGRTGRGPAGSRVSPASAQAGPAQETFPRSQIFHFLILAQIKIHLKNIGTRDFWNLASWALASLLISLRTPCVLPSSLLVSKCNLFVLASCLWTFCEGASVDFELETGKL